MLERLREKGFRVITIIDPGVKHEEGYAVFDDGREQGVFCRTEGGDLYIGQVWPGDTVFPDFVTEEARRWWGRLNAEHVASGLAGIWNDMNEPATGSIPPQRMLFDRGTASHERFHNQYALLMAMATQEGLLQAMPELRTFILSRAGSAGIQRHAANWMGDNQSRWDHLWVGIPMGAGMGVSGQPFVGADVGGFQGGTDAELFLRWMQYGVLTPFCRNHSEIGNVDQYAWAFGDHVLDLVREAVALRYRLLPYLYSAFLDAGETGEPVQRPLVFDHQDDPLVADLDDQYLFGRDLLVAPVTSAGCTARQVYLPAGDWYDWHTDEVHDGTRFVVAPTPMDRIPVYARAGAVVPMWPSRAGVHRRAPPGRDRAAPVRAAHRREPHQPAGRGRRPHPGAARRRVPPHRDHRDPHGEPRRGGGRRDRRRLPGAPARAVRPGAARGRRRRRWWSTAPRSRSHGRCRAVRQQRERVPGRARRLTSPPPVAAPCPAGARWAPPADDTEVA